MNPNRFAHAGLIVLVSLISVSAGAPARATIWYVAPSGDDSAHCQTTSTPCRTINGAIGKAAGGDTVLVSEGTYAATSGDEVVYLDKSIALSGGWDTGFAAHDGTSIIDGGGARRGVTVSGGAVAIADRFTVRNGNFITGGGIYIDYEHGTLTLNNCVITNNVGPHSGGGIKVEMNGTLTLNNCTVTNNISDAWAGGIFSYGTITINNTTISGNTAGAVHTSGGGGGGIWNSGHLILNSSTVSGNTLLGGSEGSGICNDSSLEVNNCTVSGNSGGDGDGIRSRSWFGTVAIRNSTISLNEKVGLAISDGSVNLQNSIIAGNGNADCFKDWYSGTFVSGGYNLIGNGDGCALTLGPGDQIGSSAAPIDPLLLPLQYYGGPTFMHALRSGSPALDAGNPAAPGSGVSACLPTDQRGRPRPEGSGCDIGAFEGFVATVASVVRADPDPTNAASVNFTVTFSRPVTGVDLTPPYGDFALTTTGATTGAVSAVSGSGDTYTVTVSLEAHSGNGAIRLDVVDDDSIVDAAGDPLGGEGIGNGNFTLGECYTVLTIPPPLSPTGRISLATPTYKWTRVPGATRYRYQLRKGSTVVYTKKVSSDVCRVTVCSNAPTTSLGMGSYKWRVQAMLGGAWKSYSTDMAFAVSPKAGAWSGDDLEFSVTPNLKSVDNFATYVSVPGCGSYKITHFPLVAVTNSRFGFAGPFYFNGTFSSPTRVSGQMGLEMYYLSGCGYIEGGPFSWTGVWKSPDQPTLAEEADSGPESVTPLPGFPAGSFTVKSIGPRGDGSP